MTVSFDQLPDQARAWVYTSNRLLSDQEVQLVLRHLEQFTADWSSHGTPLKAAAQIFDHSVIVLAAEDGWDAASGCSIDKSVGILKTIEQEFQISLFDRLLVLYKTQVTDPVSFISLPSLKKGIQEGNISPECLIINTQADSLKTIREGLWMQIRHSWLAKVMPVHIS